MQSAPSFTSILHLHATSARDEAVYEGIQTAGHVTSRNHEYQKGELP